MSEDNFAKELATGWINHFWSADHTMTWLDAEREAAYWLTPHTLLLGRVDALGRNAGGDAFFGEWKTMNPRSRKEWKAVWRFHPQSLTYGVLAEHLLPGTHEFTVRMAFKSTPPSYDHCWYSYTPAELVMWKRELVGIADEIRTYRGSTAPWPLNPNNCFRYGINYVCPFLETACSKLDWDGLPAGAGPRISHLEIERRINEAVSAGVEPSHVLDCPTLATLKELVILDATRVSTWLGCREKYRREYEEDVMVPPTEALVLGQDFHALLGQYYKSLTVVKETANG